MENDNSFKQALTEETRLKSSGSNNNIIWFILVLVFVFVMVAFKIKASKDEELRKQERIEYFNKLRVEKLKLEALKYKDTSIVQYIPKGTKKRFYFGAERGPRTARYIALGDSVSFEVINPDGRSIFSDPELNSKYSKNVQFLREEHEYVDIIAHSRGDEFIVKLKK